MNRHWTVKLDDVAEINPRAPKNLSDYDDVAFVPMSAVSESGRLEEHGIRPYAEVKKGYTYFERGDILVAKITPCFENGKAALVDNLVERVGFGSTEFHVLRPGPDLDGRYLFYMLWNEKFRAGATGGMTGSAGQKRVPADLLRRTEIRLPPLDEQRRIAAILDKADALRQKRKRANALLAETQSSLAASLAFSTEGKEVSIEDVANLQIGFAFKSEGYTSAVSDFRLCRGANVLPGAVDWSDLARWSSDDVTSYLQYELNAGDIVVAMDRPWISSGFKIAMVEDRDLPALLVQRVARIRAKASRDRFYLYHVLRSGEFTRHCRPTETTIPHISPKDFRSFRFHWPADAVLDDYAAESERLRKIHAVMKNAEVKAETLFSSLQHRAFSGQL